MKVHCIHCGREFEIDRGRRLVCVTCYERLLPAVLRGNKNSSCPVCGGKRPSKGLYCSGHCRRIGQIVLKRHRNILNGKLKGDREREAASVQAEKEKTYKHIVLPSVSPERPAPYPLHYGKGRTKLDDNALAAREAGMEYHEYMLFMGKYGQKKEGTKDK